MKLKETIIPLGGVLRCCFSGLCADLNPESDVVTGQTSFCIYCKEEFTLTDKNEWIPTTFLKGENR